MDYNITTLQYKSVRGMQENLPRPRTLYMSEDIEIDEELIEKLIADHKDQIARYTILHDYYLGYASIQDRIKENRHKPNNKLVAPYPSYITDILTGMFVGEPIGYSVPDEYKTDLELLQEIFDYNDEQDENFELSKYNSIMGVSYELVYVDEDNLIRFNELDPRNVVYVYDDKINPEPLFAIYFTGEGEEREVNLFTRTQNIKYIGTPLEEEWTQDNVIGKVPLIECSNNKEKMGDWERVIPLIDAYNKSISDTANDFEEFTDAFLVLYGMLKADEEDIDQMNKDKVILLDTVEGKQGAEWLIKEINDTALENHKVRLDEDIHRFTKVPNLNDDKFGGNSSGVALKYKLLALKQVISSKERKFKRFLQDRLELIIAYSEWLSLGIDLEHYDIEITFNPNVPIDEEANVKMVKDLLGMVSESTALSKLFFIDNANEEIQKKEEEKDVYNEVFTEYLHDLVGDEDDRNDKQEDFGRDGEAGEGSRRGTEERDKEDR